MVNQKLIYSVSPAAKSLRWVLLLLLFEDFAQKLKNASPNLQRSFDRAQRNMKRSINCSAMTRSSTIGR